MGRCDKIKKGFWREDERGHKAPEIVLLGSTTILDLLSNGGFIGPVPTLLEKTGVGEVKEVDIWSDA